ncbi:GNAT family N-acetyltransferase [Microbacterium sp. NPDC090281]|uniref:GNAT family N-acetyltransferase n=1 Tax=Microbacterium sp. NPDC090281 TaxID=3364208 RepID=UPI00380D3ECF
MTAPKSGDATVAVLERIAVLPASSGLGTGRALLQDAVQASKDAGFSTIELAVRQGNPAIRFYEGEGFEPISGPGPHPLGGEPMITYSRDL